MTYESNYLCHHGIKGQRWGERRFQNLDGTLTNQGKSRYRRGKEYDTERYKIQQEEWEKSQKI